LTKLLFSISQTGEHIRIEIPNEDGTIGAESILNAAELDTVILNLSNIRAGMKPEIPKELDPNPVFRNSVRGAGFIISATMAAPQAKPEVVMAGLHPGMGWIAFVMPVDETLRLAEALGILALRLRQQAPVVTMKKSLLGPNGQPL
jgi:hypothetical protein